MSADTATRIRRTNRRRLIVGAVLLLLALLLALVLLRGGPTTYQPVAVVDENVLEIAVPTAVAAGSGFEVIVADLTTEPVSVAIDDGYSLRTFTQKPTNGVATIQIPPTEGPSSGVVRVSALSGLRSGTSTIVVTPSTAVDPHDLYLGPRTILADGVDHTMIVAAPKDRFGNPVATGTNVDYIFTRPDLSVETDDRETDHLLSYSRITARTVAGKTRVAVTSDDATAREMTFLSVANQPEPFTLTVIDPVVPADGATVLRVRTDVLVDQFGNVLPDGVDTSLSVVGVTGTRRVKGETIKGVAEFSVEAPVRPGDVTMTAIASGQPSESLTFSFPPAVTRIPFAIAPDEDGLRISIGPVLTTRGAYVAEGTVAIVRVGEDRFQAPMSNGLADVVVPAGTREFEIEVLGHVAAWDELP